MADDTVGQRLARIEALLAALPSKTDLAELVTKAELARAVRDIEAEFVGIARHVDITALQRIVEQNRVETRALDLKLDVIARLLEQVVGAVAGLPPMLAALAAQVADVGKRVSALEARDH
jgi:hypothetical protein